MSMLHTCARGSHKPEEDVSFPGTGVTERAQSHHVGLGIGHRSSAGAAANDLNHETCSQSALRKQLVRCHVSHCEL